MVRATGEIGQPWLERHASLPALANFSGSQLSADADVRIAAAVRLDDRARAQQILVEQRGRFENAPNTCLGQMRSWCAGLGLDVAALPAEAVLCALLQRLALREQQEAGLRLRGRCSGRPLRHP